ncbi:hypothetical protein, partial [Asanoa sp. NPDC050611]|uniref:hypothetical protein n=1 Tax=Asanoa sp. NPDC050611 TaxID=3157098 RepID=UPI0033FBA001
TDRMISVANGLTRRLGTQGERSDDLDRLVALHSEIAARPDLPNPAQAQTFRGNALRGRWMRDPESRGDDLDAAVESYVRALELTGDDDPQRTDRMIGLANCVSRRVDTDGELPEDLDRLVALHADIAGRPDLVDPGEACAFHGNALRRRWERDPESRGDDLDAAVEAFVRALKLTGEADPQRTDRMMGLANCVSRRVDTDGELPDDLDRLIALQTEIIARSDIEELALSAAYSVSGFWLQRRWERDPEGRGDDLDAAVAAYAAALALTSDDGAHRTELMAGIGHLLARRVGSSREQADDVDRLIDLHKAILARADLDTQERTANANGLFGYWLFYRWNRGSIANGLDIHDAVEALERAVGNDPLALVPTERLVTLANALSGRLNGRTGDDEVYERSGDIDRMIEVERELLTRSDLADTAQAYAIYARWLLERWNREPSSNDDLREALSAAQAASDKTTAQADENIRRYRKAQLANLHLLCYVNKVPGASMGESVLLAESVMVSHDVGTDGLLPVLRRLTRQRSVDGAVQQGNK